MTTLVDSSLWIDLIRSRSPLKLKQFIAPFVLHPTAHVAEPIVFELLRHATSKERRQLSQQLQALPQLPTPGDLWTRATELGQMCRDKGHTIGAVDLLIAAVAVAHDAVVVTFDEDFEKIAASAGLQVKKLHRPTG